MHNDQQSSLRAFAAAASGKTIVMGMLDRDLRQVRAKVVPNVRRETLQAEVMREVKYGSSVFTDEHVGYDNLHSASCMTW